VAGVFPPLIGWAATGRALSLAVVYLCCIVFFWSPPHFWALALTRRDEYARAGIPALPVVAGSLATRWEMAAYTFALVGLSVLPVANGTFGLGYLFPALVGGAGLAVLGLSVVRSDSAGSAWLFYRVSGPYLALLLAAMLLDHLTGSPTLGTLGLSP
jgi:protoheme IX farnesyltransferase